MLDTQAQRLLSRQTTTLASSPAVINQAHVEQSFFLQGTGGVCEHPYRLRDKCLTAYFVCSFICKECVYIRSLWRQRCWQSTTPFDRVASDLGKVIILACRVHAYRLLHWSCQGCEQAGLSTCKPFVEGCNGCLLITAHQERQLAVEEL